MTTGNIYLNNDHSTGLDTVTNWNNIEGLPKDPTLHAYGSLNLGVTTDGIEQSWFAIGDGQAGWAKFDLGGGVYRTGYDSSGDEPNFCFFEANTDRISSVFGSVANFHYCWGPQILKPIIQSAIDANLPAALKWVNEGQTIKIGSTDLNLKSITSDTNLNCYYASVTPRNANSFYVRVMVEISKMTLDVEVSGVSASVTADPVYVYVGALVSYPTNPSGGLDLSATVDLLQFSTPGWNVDCDDLAAFSILLGPILYSFVNDLLTPPAENWFNQDPVNSALISALNNAISSAIGGLTS